MTGDEQQPPSTPGPAGPPIPPGQGAWSAPPPQGWGRPPQPPAGPPPPMPPMPPGPPPGTHYPTQQPHHTQPAPQQAPQPQEAGQWWADPGQPSPPPPSWPEGRGPWYGDQQAQPAGSRRGRGRTIGLIIGIAVIVIAVVVLLLGFLAPGFFTGTVFDTESVENGVTAELRGQGYAVDTGSVQCPDKITVREGGTFTCTLAVDGEEMTVTSTMLDDEGTYRVGAPATR